MMAGVVVGSENIVQTIKCVALVFYYCVFLTSLTGRRELKLASRQRANFKIVFQDSEK